jgi:hypothetical protein
MIQLVQSFLAPIVASDTTQNATFMSSVTQGNLIAVVGTYNLVPGSAIIISDSLNNVYTVDQPLSDGLVSSYWFAYAVAQSTGALIITVHYTGTVAHSCFLQIEFFNSIGWTNPPAPDGLSFLAGNSTTLSSGPITTTNADDLAIALYTNTGSSASINGAVWHFILQISTTHAVAWSEVIPDGLITPFSAVQTTGAWGVSVWTVQANLVAPNTIDVITAVINPTAWIEVYPNRIKEDIYDSLESNPQFVYVQYGPSLLNG